MHVSGFNKTKTLYEKIFPLFSGKNSYQARKSEIAMSCGRMVTAVSNRFPVKTTCLDRAVTAWAILKMLDIPVELQIGVDKDHEDFTAHAWVTVDGKIIINELDDNKITANSFTLDKC